MNTPLFHIVGDSGICLVFDVDAAVLDQHLPHPLTPNAAGGRGQLVLLATSIHRPKVLSIRIPAAYASQLLVYACAVDRGLPAVYVLHHSLNRRLPAAAARLLGLPITHVPGQAIGYSTPAIAPGVEDDGMLRFLHHLDGGSLDDLANGPLSADPQPARNLLRYDWRPRRPRPANPTRRLHAVCPRREGTLPAPDPLAAAALDQTVYAWRGPAGRGPRRHRLAMSAADIRPTSYFTTPPCPVRLLKTSPGPYLRVADRRPQALLASLVAEPLAAAADTPHNAFYLERPSLAISR